MLTKFFNFFRRKKCPPACYVSLYVGCGTGNSAAPVVQHISKTCNMYNFDLRVIYNNTFEGYSILVSGMDRGVCVITELLLHSEIMKVVDK